MKIIHCKLREHPDYERILKEVLPGQYQTELFASVSEKTTDKCMHKHFIFRKFERKK